MGFGGFFFSFFIKRRMHESLWDSLQSVVVKLLPVKLFTIQIP